ncbi:hypothetical protein [Methylobacterium segetis]|uniref:hypothetical protein n=1 Tax=Methylobacterium segetis TaxID=2488750 RepID=UPI00104F7485|nr:hypothetical protein [Methylobacterium segetis]
MSSQSFAARLSAGPVLALLFLLAAESALLTAWLQEALSEAAALAAHGVVLLAFLARRAVFAEDLTIHVVALLLAACSGPAGAAAALVLYVVLARTPVSHHELESWYRQISGVGEANPAVALHAQIVDGRARRAGRVSIDHFPSVLEGALTQQQALLGLIGLAYHPDYRPLLGQALRSAEPSIRVHAAAVSVKLRARARLEFQKARGRDHRAEPPASLFSRATELARLAAGGFLDEADARNAREVAAGLCEETLTLIPEHRPAHVLLCTLLAQLGRWEDVIARSAATPFRRGDPQAEALTQSLMQLGRTKELHAILARTAGAEALGGGHALPV